MEEYKTQYPIEPGSVIYYKEGEEIKRAVVDAMGWQADTDEVSFRTTDGVWVPEAALV